MYLSIENPSVEIVVLSFKAINFITIIEEISSILKEWDVAPSQCVKTEEDKDNEAISSENEQNTEEEDEHIKPPC